MNYTIFIFRRDFRLFDNNGLIYAIKNYENIIPIFIFTPEQITKKNKFKSDNAIQFMIESLKDLNSELKKHKSKLHIFKGDNIKILNSIKNKIKLKNIVFNMDYTPYAVKRDNNITKFAKENDININIIEDYLLHPIGSLNKKDGNPYTVFTPFKNNGMKLKPDKPMKIKITNLVKTNKLKTVDYINHTINDNILVKGGRDYALKQLNKIKNQKKYNQNRNTLSIQTTLLSAYIKFGCLSIREVYWKFRDVLGSKIPIITIILERILFLHCLFSLCF